MTQETMQELTPEQDKMMRLELELEHEALTAGVEKYRDNLKIRGQLSTQPGQRLLSAVTEDLVAAIRDGIEVSLNGRASKHGTIIQKLKNINAGVLAHLTARCIIQCIGESRSTSQTGNLIGALVSEHDDWTRMMSQHKGLAYTIRNQLKKSSSERHQRAVVRHVVGQYSESQWTEVEQMKVGAWLLELALAHTGVVHKQTSFNGRKRTSFLEATPETEAILADAHKRCEGLSPVYMPMVTPPQPWTSIWSGGYLQRRIQFIKTHDKEYLRGLDMGDMTEVFDAINTLQEVPYRVNKSVLGVMDKGWKDNARLPGMPDANPQELPGKPLDIATNDVARKEWKRGAAKVHEHNATVRGERVAMSMLVSIGSRFSNYERIYFPHTIDWRGRAYPVPIFLNPQGDDMAKSLLQFAEGKELGEEGVLWLKVHIANLFGVDKVAFSDRIQWVDDNHVQLIQSALFPENAEFWRTADKPWQALAACFEYAGAMMMHGGPEEYVSHLPIAMDGSCNGLQNLSAMLKDPVGGAATNLIPSALPQDIYTQVAERVLSKLRVMAADVGTDEDIRMARMWLGMGVGRKLVKRPVMTKPYGVTAFGIRDQMKQEIASQCLIKDRSVWLKKDTDKPEKAEYYAASFLAPLVSDAINEQVVAAKDVMDWLQESAKAAAAEGLPLEWVTPIGLRVRQSYQKMSTKQHKASIGGQVVRVSVAKPTGEINARKQSTGMSPNVVHSFDAAHMMKTVNACYEHGITNLAMVHDSYATNACDVGTMNALLRGAFVKMYQPQVLEDLYQQFHEQVGDVVELPLPPTTGDRDLTLVEDSLYFFA